MLSKSEAIREDKPGFHGYGSLSFLSQEKCNARTAGRKEQKQGQIHGQRVAQLLNIFHAGTSKKRLFLTAWRSVGLGYSGATYIFYCSCAVTALAVSTEGHSCASGPCSPGRASPPLKEASAGVPHHRDQAAKGSELPVSRDGTGAGCSLGPR